MILPAEIFKAYDIRGIVGKTLTPAVVQSVGQALGTLAQERGRDTLVVGRDGRLSGPDLAGALSTGIRASGANVIDIGMVTTPISYFAAHHLGTQCSVMVTGSHNPPDYNGLKMVIAGDTLAGEEIKALKTRIESGDLRHGAGELRQLQYVQKITLVLVPIYASKQLIRSVFMAKVYKLAGGDFLGPKLHGKIQKRFEFDFPVAQHIRVWRTPGLVFLQKVVKYPVAVFLGEIDSVIGDANGFAYRLHIPPVVLRGAYAIFVLFFPVFHEHAHDIKALPLEQQG
jgi:hypothetical protein